MNHPHVDMGRSVKERRARSGDFRIADPPSAAEQPHIFGKAGVTRERAENLALRARAGLAIRKSPLLVRPTPRDLSPAFRLHHF